MARGFGSTDSVAGSRTGTDVRFGRGESTREGCQRTLSRTRGRERMVRFGRGESTREGGCQWRGDLGQRTLSRARGRERMSALGGSKTPPSSGVDFHFFLYLVFASATCLSGSRGK